MRNRADFVSDDELITPEDTHLSQSFQLEIKPGKPKKKSCSNCTCGKKEANASPETKDMPASKCGSCYLGDAFRCESCPYMGLPPFSPNDAVSFDSGEF
ncbi:anamorsin [Nematocida sp. AWRm77]|nr:anamorsin [Nematocida sp. AWRm77]